jgi:hypothetical protein
MACGRYKLSKYLIAANVIFDPDVDGTLESVLNVVDLGFS